MLYLEGTCQDLKIGRVDPFQILRIGRVLPRKITSSAPVYKALLINFTIGSVVFLLHLAWLNRRVVLIKDAKDCVEHSEINNKGSSEDTVIFINMIRQRSVGCLYKFVDFHAWCFDGF